MVTKRRSPLAPDGMRCAYLAAHPSLRPQAGSAHPWHELLYVVAGDYMQDRRGSAPIPVPPGHALLVPAGVWHRPGPERLRDLDLIVLSWRGMPDPSLLPACAAAVPDRLGRLGALLRWLLAESDAAMRAALWPPIWAWLALAGRAGPDPDPGLATAVRFMEQQSRQYVNTDYLARLAGLRRSQFAARFQRAYGVSPMRYWRELRLERARNALQIPGRTLAAVAAELGFAQPRHLARLLRHRHRAGQQRLPTAAARI